jgi:hypothetical protein
MANPHFMPMIRGMGLVRPARRRTADGDARLTRGQSRVVEDRGLSVGGRDGDSGAVFAYRPVTAGMARWSIDPHGRILEVALVD